MTINTTDLSELDQATVEEREQLLTTLLSELFPELDLGKGGILQQLLMYPNALFDTMNRDEVDAMRRSMSLQEINDDPTLADEDIVDSLMSNYFITRTAATAATGEMAIVISSLATTQVPATTVFTNNDRTFVPNQDYVGLINASLITADNERAIQQRPDGNYWFTITVVEQVDSGSRVDQGAIFTASPEPTGFVEAYAVSDFQAGTVEESNADLVSRLDDGIAAQATADRVSIESMLRTNFASIIDLSIIGFGDEEMRRDRNNIFGISCGGKGDIYVRTAAAPYTTKISVAALPMSVRDAEATIPYSSMDVTTQFSISPTVLPAFYRFERAAPMDPASETTINLTLLETGERGIYSPPDAEFEPTINEPSEATFSAYQGSATVNVQDAESQPDHRERILAAVRGLDTVSVYIDGVLTAIPVSEGDVTIDTYLTNGYRFYDLYMSYIPSIVDIQNFVNSRSRRSPAADYLVRAAIPCFVSIDVEVAYPATQTAPTETSVKTAIANAVNAVRFTAPSLPAATIVDAVADLLGNNGYAVLPLTMRGSVLKPDGTTESLESQSELVITDDPSLSVSRRTVAYYLSTDDIFLTLTPVSTINV